MHFSKNTFAENNEKSSIIVFFPHFCTFENTFAENNKKSSKIKFFFEFLHFWQNTFAEYNKKSSKIQFFWAFAILKLLFQKIMENAPKWCENLRFSNLYNFFIYNNFSNISTVNSSFIGRHLWRRGSFFLKFKNSGKFCNFGFLYTFCSLKPLRPHQRYDFHIFTKIHNFCKII